MELAKSLKMSNGCDIPQFALGTFKTTSEEIKDTIETAISVGYRHIDCAWIYENEKDIGQILNDQIKDGRIKRTDLFLTGKLWSSFHNFERVHQQCLATINDLNCEYLDLFLIHWPFAMTDKEPNHSVEMEWKVVDESDLCQTWKAMELLVDAGLVKSIGVSNFTEQQIERILQICKYKPVVNQVEIHPYCPQLELEAFCKKHQILLEAYAPLGAKARDWKEKNDPEVLEDKIIMALAKKYNVEPASILLRYIIDRNIVCVAKSSNRQRIKENFLLFQANQFHLDDGDFQKIHTEITTRFRYYKMAMAQEAKEYPFKNWQDFIP